MVYPSMLTCGCERVVKKEVKAMGNFFKMDSPVMIFLSKVADLMILNILTILFCIPVFTAGASLTAMWSVLLKMVRKEEPTVSKAFFSSFKLNFKQSTIIWLVLVAFGAVIGLDFYMFTQDKLFTVFPSAIRYAILAVAIIVIVVFMYVFPIQSRFDNKVFATLRNALFMSIAQLPKTVVMLVLYLAAGVVYYSLLGAMFPVILCLGITVPCYLNAKVINSIFKRIEPKKDVEEESQEYQPLSIFSEDEKRNDEESDDKVDEETDETNADTIGEVGNDEGETVSNEVEKEE